MTDEVVADAVVICGAKAEHCVCLKPFGHELDDDPVHQCKPGECSGEWTGTYGEDDFEVVTFPGRFGGVEAYMLVMMAFMEGGTDAPDEEGPESLPELEGPGR